MRSVALVSAAAGLTVGLYGAAPVQAEPPPAPPPVPPATTGLIPAIGNVLAQAGTDSAGPLGLPDLSGYAPNLLLGQTAAPALPGTPAVTIPDLRASNPEYLLPQNQTPAPPGAGTPAPGIGPSPDIPGTGRIDLLRRLYEMYQAGQLRGALLGQQPPEEFGPQTPPS